MAFQEIGLNYTLTNLSTGNVMVFNDPTDPNYLGMLTDVSGLDSPEVRESADDRVQADGGLHGDFFYGRRPITLSGILLNPSSALDRQQKMDRFSAVADLMRSNGLLTWTGADGIIRGIQVRRQQPVRFSGNWQKNFQLQLVAADPRIYSYSLNSVVTPASAVTNYITNPNFGISGATTGWTQNAATGSSSIVAGNLREVCPGTNASEGVYFKATAGPGSYQPILSSVTAISGTASLVLTAYALNASNTVLASVTTGTIVIVHGATASLVTPTLTAPAGTAFVKLAITAATTAARTFDINGASTRISYFDGSTPGSKWSGTAGASTSVSAGEITVTNVGNTNSYPTIYIDGPSSGTFTLFNVKTGVTMSIALAISSGQTLTLDMKNHTAYTSDGTNRYSSVVFSTSSWPAMVPGINIWRWVTSSGTYGGNVRIDWNDAWI